MFIKEEECGSGIYLKRIRIHAFVNRDPHQNRCIRKEWANILIGLLFLYNLIFLLCFCTECLS